MNSIARTAEVRWYDPRSGGDLQQGSVPAVQGPGPVSIGSPPRDVDKDWAVLVRKTAGPQP
ncbi:MAG: hypothetical protein ACYC6Y_15335 [Thermoguttaceae bacterium]